MSSVTPCGTVKAPEGWHCTRELGHEGPCAAKPIESVRRPKISKQELKRQLSEIINSRRAKPSKLYQWAVDRLMRLESWDGKTKPKPKHARSHNGPIQETLRREAREKREALAVFEKSNTGVE